MFVCCLRCAGRLSDLTLPTFMFVCCLLYAVRLSILALGSFTYVRFFLRAGCVSNLTLHSFMFVCSFALRRASLEFSLRYVHAFVFFARGGLSGYRSGDVLQPVSFGLAVWFVFRCFSTVEAL